MSLKSLVVDHWKRMREDAPGVYVDIREMPGEKDCVFCRRFKTDHEYEDECQGCPIQIATSANTCARGPYLAAQAAWVAYKDSGWDESQRDWWHLKADLMIKFLEGLPDDV